MFSNHSRRVDGVVLPDDYPVRERQAVRVVVLDAADRILLFRTRDVVHPRLGQWWELPGGGIDPGETYVDAAVRELREETGIAVGPAQISAPTWSRRASFLHRRRRNVQDEVVVLVRLGAVGADIDVTGQLDYEREDYTDFRWWPVDEVTDSRERFYPGRLPALLAPFLRGEAIREPFELWS